MPDLLAHASEVHRLIDYFERMGRPPGKATPSAQPRQVSNGLRLERWGTLKTAEAKVSDRRTRWNDVIRQMTVDPRFVAQHPAAATAARTAHAAPAPVKETATAPASGRLYPALPLPGLLGLYPELAMFQSEYSLPRHDVQICQSDEKRSRVSRKFRFVDNTPHRPSAPPAGPDTLRQLGLQYRSTPCLATGLHPA